MLFIKLLHKLLARYADKRLIHVILDNFKIHKSKQVWAWLRQFGGRIRLHFLPPYSPDDNRITHGCINVSPEFYEQVVRPTFERGGVFYVLPDTASIAETFPEFAQSRATAQGTDGSHARPARQ